MAKSKYFMDRLPKLALDTLQYDPECFEQKYRGNLIQIVKQDMELLSSLAVPMHTREYHSDPYDSWQDDSYYYYANNIKTSDIKTLSNVLEAYYGDFFDDNIGGKFCEHLWSSNDNKKYWLRQKPCKQGVFECQRAMYFYKNYDIPAKLSMEKLDPKNGNNRYVDDFCDWYDKKMRYSKSELQDKIDGCCANIVDKEIKEAKDKLAQLKQQEQRARDILQQIKKANRKRAALAQRERGQKKL